MKKILIIALTVLLSISLFGCTNKVNAAQQNGGGQQKQEVKQNDEADKKAVESLVGGFGKKLQSVSLQAPKDILGKSMQENYGDFVTLELLTKWMSDPLNAPGRLTSSPWPDRIEISSIVKTPEKVYQVKGDIIEITSVEKEKGGAAAKRPITLTVKNIDSRWVIDAVALGAYEDAGSITYKNGEYGFSFTLPQGWKGYTIVSDKWEGLAVGDPQGEKVVENGPVISIRHPQWTAENPRQDIPIMVFTLKQWNELQQDKFHIGAAPIGPRELGRNAEYVFALPARYNFAFPAGYEEVESILEGNPLHTTTDNFKK